jgi:hypothetical protein
MDKLAAVAEVTAIFNPDLFNDLIAAKLDADLEEQQIKALFLSAANADRHAGALRACVDKLGDPAALHAALTALGDLTACARVHGNELAAASENCKRKAQALSFAASASLAHDAVLTVRSGLKGLVCGLGGECASCSEHKWLMFPCPGGGPAHALCSDCMPTYAASALHLGSAKCFNLDCTASFEKDVLVNGLVLKCSSSDLKLLMQNCTDAGFASGRMAALSEGKGTLLQQLLQCLEVVSCSSCGAAYGEATTSCEHGSCRCGKTICGFCLNQEKFCDGRAEVCSLNPRPHSIYSMNKEMTQLIARAARLADFLEKLPSAVRQSLMSQSVLADRLAAFTAVSDDGYQFAEPLGAFLSPSAPGFIDGSVPHEYDMVHNRLALRSASALDVAPPIDFGTIRVLDWVKMKGSAFELVSQVNWEGVQFKGRPFQRFSDVEAVRKLLNPLTAYGAEECLGTYGASALDHIYDLFCGSVLVVDVSLPELQAKLSTWTDQHLLLPRRPVVVLERHEDFIKVALTDGVDVFPEHNMDLEFTLEFEGLFWPNLKSFRIAQLGLETDPAIPWELTSKDDKALMEAVYLRLEAIARHGVAERAFTISDNVSARATRDATRARNERDAAFGAMVTASEGLHEVRSTVSKRLRTADAGPAASAADLSMG